MFDSTLKTIVFCLVAMFLGASSWVCMSPSVWYISWEFHEAENRYLEMYCSGRRETLPLFAGLYPESWTLDGFLTCLGPFVVGSLTYCLFS